MPKMKTKSSAKKRFSFTATGKVKTSQAKHKHNLRKRSARSLRNQKGTTIMKECDAVFVKAFMPYGSK